MYYTQLRAFHAVAKAGGFSRGAQMLGLTQPALSDQVRKLEDAFGVVLFDRIKRTVKLTETGSRLLEITNRLFEVEAEAIDYLAETEALRSGRLRIMIDSAFHVLQILRRFRDAYPGIALSIAIGNSDQVLDRLVNFEADIGIFADLPDDARLYSIRLRSDPLVAFVALDHPWAERRSITLAELAGQSLVLREPGSVTRRLIEQAFADKGLTVRSSIDVEGREAAREVVAAGIGVGVVSRPEFGSDNRLRMIDIADCDQVMDEALVCLQERAEQRLIKAFLDCVRDAVTDP